MIWSAEIKQLLRTLTRTLAFCLALTLVIGLLNVIIGIVQASDRTMQTISDTYITVGTIPRLSYKNFTSFSDYIEKSEKLVELGKKLLPTTSPKATSLQLENVISQNSHSWLAAYNLSITPLVMTSQEDGYTANLNKPQNLGLFAVECVDTALLRRSESPSEKDFLQYTYPYQLRVLEQRNFGNLYLPEWSNALCKDRKHLDVLGVGAYDGEKLIGLAGCSADCDTMWQIGIDVLPEYRRQGIASALTSRLAVEILKRGKVPFYCAAWCNVKSVRNAIRSGFRPAWV